nr:condensation domain-containing protein [Cupriavidus taiwanensis]
MQPSWLACRFDLPGEFNAVAFTEALRGWVTRHEALRSQFIVAPSAPPGERFLRTTLPADAVRIRRSAAADFTDGRKLARYLENLFDREVLAIGWPGYLLATVSRPQATTVYVAADHTLMDCYSIFHTTYEIQQLYASAHASTRSTAASILPEQPPSYLDFAEAERTASGALNAEHESIARWRSFISESGGQMPQFPVSVSEATGSPAAQPSGYTELFNASDALSFGRVCRTVEGNSFAGLLACLAKVGQEFSSSNVFRTMVPVNTQTERFQFSIGWYVGMGPVAFPIKRTDSFAEVVRSAVAGLDGLRDLARIPLPRVAELLGQPLRDPFMVSYMDLRHTPGASNWNTWGTTVFRSRCTDPDEVFFWFIRTHDGFHVSYRHPATELAGIAVPHYVERTKAILRSVASNGDWPALTSLLKNDRIAHDGHQTHCGDCIS